MWPIALSVLRVVRGVLLLEHGTQKLLGFPPPSNGTDPAAFTLIWFAGVIDLVGGALLILGLFTRPAAFLASGRCAFAYSSRMRRSPFPALNGGDAAILFCFIFLFIAIAGGGSAALDNHLRARR